MDELKPCPCCEGESDCNNTGIQTQDGTNLWWVECLVCGLSTDGHETKEQALDTWNRRPAPENNPLTLEQLRNMDGEPVFIVESPNWGHWELAEDAEDYLCDRDPDFYGMMLRNDPQGRYGLHVLGWIAYARKPEQEGK